MTPTPEMIWANLSPAAQWVLQQLRGDAWIAEKTLRNRFADLFGTTQAEGLGTTLGQLVFLKLIQSKRAGGSFHYRARAEGLEVLRAGMPREFEAQARAEYPELARHADELLASAERSMARVRADVAALKAAGEEPAGWERTTEPGGKGWFISGYDADPGWSVSDVDIARLGRKHTEKILGIGLPLGLPPLPEQAWDVLAPEPDPDPVTITYAVETTTPELYVGVTDKGRIMIGEKPNGGGVNWSHQITNPDMLSQVLEQARVDQARIARERYPLPEKIRKALAAAPPMGQLSSQVALVTEADHHMVIRELHNMEREGTVRKLIAQPGGVRWALKR